MSRRGLLAIVAAAAAVVGGCAGAEPGRPSVNAALGPRSRWQLHARA